MDKKQFLDALKNALKGLPDEEKAQTLAYYSEMIDDRCDSGMSEEDAVLSLGSVDDIARGMLEESRTPSVEDQTDENLTGEKTGIGALIGKILLCLLFINITVWAWGLDIMLWSSGLTVAILSVFKATVSNGGLIFVGYGIILCSFGLALFIPFIRLTKFTAGKIKAYFHQIRSFFKGKEA